MIRNWSGIACAALAALATVAVMKGLNGWAGLLVATLLPWDVVFKVLSSWTEEAVKTWVAGQRAREEQAKLAELEKIS